MRLELHRRQFGSSEGRYLAVSPRVARDLEAFEGVHPDRIDIVSNGVDTTTFVPDHTNRVRNQMRSDLEIEADTLLLLLVAHNHRLKGLPTILKALATMSDAVSPVHLLVAGGPTRKTQRIGRHRVSYLGNVDPMLTLYQSVDALLHPTRHDACSLAVLEAMACGLPTVTTTENGASHFIEDGCNGLILANPLDHLALSRQIDLLADPSLRSKMGTNARATMKTWSAEHNFRAIEDVYRLILRTKRSHPAVTVPIQATAALDDATPSAAAKAA